MRPLVLLAILLPIRLLGPARAVAKGPTCDDTNVPIDGGTLVLHDCVVATKAGATAPYDEHTRSVMLRLVPLEGAPLEVELAPVSDGYEWREAWRVVGVLKDETKNLQAVLLALDVPGGLARFEVRKLPSSAPTGRAVPAGAASFPLLWKSPQLVSVAIDVQRSRATVQGKVVTQGADLDELEQHGAVDTLRIVLRDGQIAERH